MVSENISWPNSMVREYPPCTYVHLQWYTKQSFQLTTCRYSSRLSYAHTAAVMSMVGYVLGLGDRHGENILFDSTSGDCIHVDFNCLFNRVRMWVQINGLIIHMFMYIVQGETFDVPEVVPFRLTHNMVHALVSTEQATQCVVLFIPRPSTLPLKKWRHVYA